MTSFHLRTDLERSTLGSFALPLGLKPIDLQQPLEGYTIAYNPGEEESPDVYSFYVVASHEKIAPLLQRLFELLPREVYAIFEIGSQDAYRSTDVYVGREPIGREEFLRVWREVEPVLLEECLIGAGANSEEPFIEVFVDQWKGVSIHVPLSEQERISTLLQGAGLDEVPQTWTDRDGQTSEGTTEIRPVLDEERDDALDLEELVQMLRYEWGLELDVDPEVNLDEAGHELGMTLWYVVAVLDPINGGNGGSGSGGGGDGGAGGSSGGGGAYAVAWVTAPSINELTRLIEQELRKYSEWALVDLYSVDRVAYDERPDELTDLPPRPGVAKVHLFELEVWDAPGSASETAEQPEKPASESS